MILIFARKTIKAIKRKISMPVKEYTATSAGIDEQIKFIKSEKRRLLIIACSLKDMEMSHVLMRKVRIYTDLEQNMYALRAIASQILQK